MVILNLYLRYLVGDINPTYSSDMQLISKALGVLDVTESTIFYFMIGFNKINKHRDVSKWLTKLSDSKFFTVTGKITVIWNAAIFVHLTIKNPPKTTVEVMDTIYNSFRIIHMLCPGCPFQVPFLIYDFAKSIYDKVIIEETINTMRRTLPLNDDDKLDIGFKIFFW